MEWNTSGDLILFCFSALGKGPWLCLGVEEKVRELGQGPEKGRWGQGVHVIWLDSEGESLFDPEEASTPHGVGRTHCPYVKTK